MIYVYSIVAFMYGTVFGSFLHLVACRSLEGQSITGRSKCDSCGVTIKPHHLIPIVSYLLLSGKCSNCKKKIGFGHVLIELSLGLMYASSVLLLGVNYASLLFAVLVSLLMTVTITDIKSRIIPDNVLLVFLPIIFYIVIFSDRMIAFESLFGGLVGFSLTLIISMVTKGGFGGGDIKLFGVLGLALGWKLILLTFMLSCLVGMLLGIFGKADLVDGRKYIAFAPSIFVATVVSYLWGNQLISIYLGML